MSSREHSSKAVTWCWAIVLIAGLASWLACAILLDAPAAWRALLVNFAYFTPLAAGLVVWPAVVTASRGRWMGPAQRPALAGVAFAPVSVAVLAALWIGAPRWAPWFGQRDLANAAWLDPPLLFGRDMAALLVLWALCGWFVRRCRAGGASRAPAGWLVLGYCLVMSLLGFDLVMALDPHWFSTLFGGYYFVSGMYAAAAAWTLMVTIWEPGAGAGRRHDLGKLMVALSLLTTYTMFSQLIVAWYENLPDEVRFVIPRMRLDRWGPVSAALLAVVYLGPLAYLLTTWSKRSRGFLGVAAAAVLIGTWAERWWLVTATLSEDHRVTFDPPLAPAAAAMLAALVLGARWALRRMPEQAGPAVKEAPSA